MVLSIGDFNEDGEPTSHRPKDIEGVWWSSPSAGPKGVGWSNNMHRRGDLPSIRLRHRGPKAVGPIWGNDLQ